MKVFFLQSLLLGSFIFSSPLFSFALEEARVPLQDGRNLMKGGFSLTQTFSPAGILSNPAQVAQSTSLLSHLELLSPLLIWSNSLLDLVQLFSESNQNSILQSLRSFENEVIHGSIHQHTGLILKKVAVGTFQKGNLSTGTLWEPISGAMTLYSNLKVRTGAYISSGYELIPEKLALGVSLKSVTQAAYENHLSLTQVARMMRQQQDFNAFLTSGLRRGSGVGLDTGLLFRQQEKFFITEVGLTVQDLGLKYRWVPEGFTAPDPERATLNLGGSLSFASELSKFTLGLDFRDLLFAYGNKLFKHVFTGLEMSFADLIGMGIGLYQGYWSYGLYASLKFIHLNFGAYTAELGELPGEVGNQRLFAQVKLGWLL